MELSPLSTTSTPPVSLIVSTAEVRVGPGDVAGVADGPIVLVLPKWPRRCAPRCKACCRRRWRRSRRGRRAGGARAARVGKGDVEQAEVLGDAAYVDGGAASSTSSSRRGADGTTIPEPPLLMIKLRLT